MGIAIFISSLVVCTPPAIFITPIYKFVEAYVASTVATIVGLPTAFTTMYFWPTLKPTYDTSCATVLGWFGVTDTTTCTTIEGYIKIGSCWFRKLIPGTNVADCS